MITDLIHRETLGIEKYGVTVDEANLTQLQWLQHAYEEALDMSIYLKKLINKSIERQKLDELREIL